MKLKKPFILIMVVMLCFALVPNQTKAEGDENTQDATTQEANTQDATTQMDITAAQGILVEAKSGNVIWSKDAYTKTYPASTTKIMTAILFYEANKDNMERQITVPKDVEDLPSDGSMMGLVEGEIVTVNELFMGLMLISGNDAALVMAIDMAGSEAEFVKLMNQRAKDLSMLSTNFSYSHGYHHENHYTTAYDFSILARSYLGYDYLREVAKTESYDIRATNKNLSRTFNNSNALIRTVETEGKEELYFENAIGIKTGYTSAAKNCLVSAATLGDKEVIAVTFGTPSTDQRFIDAKKLLNYGLTEFTQVNVYEYIKDTNVSIDISTLNVPEYAFGGLDVFVYVNQNELISVHNDIVDSLDKTLVEAKFNPVTGLVYPITEGQLVGYVEYYQGEQLIYTAQAVSMKYVDKRTMPNIVNSAITLDAQGMTKQNTTVEQIMYMGMALRRQEIADGINVNPSITTNTQSTQETNVNQSTQSTEATQSTESTQSTADTAA